MGGFLLRMNDKEEFAQVIQNFNEHLQKIRGHIDLVKDMHQSDLSEVEPQELAQLNCALAYSTHAILWVYLKSVGVQPAKSPVKPELDRIQSYMKRLGEYKPPKGRQLTLNKEASKRILTAELNQGAQSKKRNRTTADEGSTKRVKSSE